MKTSLILAAVLLAACGGEPAGEPAGDTIGKDIAEDYAGTLDEAAAVEDLALEAKERVDAALDEADGAARD